MQERHVKIQCPQRDFYIVAFDIDRTGADREVVNQALTEAFGHGADPHDTAGQLRNPSRLLKTRYLGVLAENLLMRHLRDKLGAGVSVESRDFVDYSQHVDIEINRNGRSTTLEVRSSFLFARPQSIVCNLHGVIGPYSTGRKPGESPKDFYLYAFINVAIDRFNMQAEHTLFFASGAPYQMFIEKGERRNLKQEGADYLLIVPMVNAMDAIEIVDAIRRQVGGV